VGAQVVYGVVGLKTHAKMLLVTRREAASVTARYGHPVHRQLQPAHGAPVHRPELPDGRRAPHADMDNVFLHLASQSRLPKLHKLLVAPFTCTAA
jgi:polyphosphate kinase